MPDTRFYSRSGPFSVGHIAQQLGAELSNASHSDTQIHDLAALDTAGANDVSVFSDREFHKAACGSSAGAVITTRNLGQLIPNAMCRLYVPNPRLAFTQIVYLFYPARAIESGIHPAAIIDPQATLGQGCRVDAGATIGSGVTLGQRCHIESNAVICDGVTIGDDCRIGANTTVRNALIGSRVRIESNCSIGGEGFGFVPDAKGLLRTAQLGRVIIADNVEIGCNSAIDRGAIGDTVIGRGTVIDNLVHIAHNVQIGCNCVLAGQVGIAGSTSIGDNVVMGGRSAIADHITIGSNVRIASGSGVIRDAPSGEVLGGYPAIPIRQWHRQTAGLMRLFGKKARPPSSS
jgi:UDP-3-O-[3-hydroxymyristoyl] glucosamine N-acyltransferase